MSLQTTDIRKLNHVPELGRAHAAVVGSVHHQGLMDAPTVVEVDIARQRAPQVSLAQHDDVVQTLAAKGADDSLGVGILPGASRCGEQFLDGA